MIIHDRSNDFYFGTIDMNNTEDVALIASLRKKIKRSNKKLRELQKQSSYNPNASYSEDWGKINPKRLTLHGRGPRRIAELRDGVRKGSYTSDLPIRHSKTVDLYIHNNYRSRSWYNDTRSI